MVSACFFWPGSEAAVQGIRPTIWNRYDGKVPNQARVKTVLDWLRLPPARRPHILTLYFSELDSVSHENPLDLPRVEQAAQSLDRVIGQLADGIDTLPIRDRIYLLVTSDHGMVNTWPTQTIQLDALLDAGERADVEIGFGGPVASLHVKGGTDRARELRDRINARLARGIAYLRGELPERYHYRTNPRAGDVVVVMDEAWTLSIPRTPAAGASPATSSRPSPGARGQHGWDNGFPSMRALFLAVGPGIREDAIVEDVENVDVYPLMTELLGIPPAAGVDGRRNHIRRLISR
jgi:arylsulfatase A-like enzyme